MSSPRNHSPDNRVDLLARVADRTALIERVLQPQVDNTQEAVMHRRKVVSDARENCREGGYWKKDIAAALGMSKGRVEALATSSPLLPTLAAVRKRVDSLASHHAMELDHDLVPLGDLPAEWHEDLHRVREAHNDACFEAHQFRRKYHAELSAFLPVLRRAVEVAGKQATARAASITKDRLNALLGEEPTASTGTSAEPPRPVPPAPPKPKRGQSSDDPLGDHHQGRFAF